MTQKLKTYVAFPELGDKPNHPKSFPFPKQKLKGQKGDLSVLSIFVFRKVAMDHLQ